MTRSSYWDIGIIILLSGIVIFFNLSGIPLLDPDEPVYAETAKEMLAQHSFISPMIYGDFWYDKPPMYYWLIMGAAQLFGINDFSARFPSAFLGLCGPLLLYVFVKEIFNRRTAFISALILTTSIEYFYLSKAAVTDITLTLFITISLLSFIRQKYYLFYFFMGLAVLTKGPIGFFPGIIGLVYLLCSQNLRELRYAKLFFGTCLLLLVAAPWYLAMGYLHGGDFVDTFFGFHNITRFASPEHPDKSRWYFYIPVFVIGFFPWCTLLPQAIYRSLTQATKHFPQLLFFNIWALLVFLFFSVAQTKLVSYILPLYPAAAVLAGWYVNELWDEFYVPARPYGWIAGMLLLCLGFAYGSWTGLKALPGTETSALFLLFVFVFLGGFAIYFLWKRQIANAFFLHILGMVALALIVAGALFPAVSPQFSSLAVAQEFKALQDVSQPVYITKFLRPGMAFYADTYGNELLFTREGIPDMDRILQDHPQAYVILREIDYQRLSEASKQKLLLLKKVDNNLILQGQPFLAQTGGEFQ